MQQFCEVPMLLSRHALFGAGPATDSSSTMAPTRQRPVKLRSGNVTTIAKKGRTDPLSHSDQARAFLNYLSQFVPPNSFILIPRTWKEAHNRHDSLCAVLGIPFTELGPLLYAAGILVKYNTCTELSFSLDGFQKLIDWYRREPSNQIVVERRKPPLNEWNADLLTETKHPPTFWYLFRGSTKRQSAYQYIPLVAADVVVSTPCKIARIKNARALGKTILAGCDSKISDYFLEPTRPAISVATTLDADNPNRISPDQETEHRSTFATPSMRARIYASFEEPRGTTAGDSSEFVSEASEDFVPLFPATIAEEIELSRQLDFDVRVNNQRPPRHPNVGTPIDVTDQKRATEAMRAKIVWLAEQWGFRQCPTSKEKLVTAEMASRVVFYDMGCPKPPKGSMVVNWITELDNARVNNSTNFAQVLTSVQLGPRKGTYTDQIEAANPGYFHDLFRLTGKSKVSLRGTWEVIATEMSRLSKDQSPRDPSCTRVLFFKDRPL